MSEHPILSCFTRSAGSAVLVVALIAIAGANPASAGEMAVGASAVLGPRAPAHELDGRTFYGSFGLLGKNKMGSDIWNFRNGRFMSEQCVECGYPDGPYAVDTQDGEINFVTETQCPITPGATIVWRGKIKANGEIEGVYTWSVKRWYRTVTRQFWFKGKLADSVAGAPVKPAVLQAGPVAQVSTSK
jgi:hypothetical protein